MTDKEKLLAFYLAKFESELGRKLTLKEIDRSILAFGRFYHGLALGDMSSEHIKSIVEFKRATGFLAQAVTAAEPWYVSSGKPNIVIQCWSDGRKIEGTFSYGTFTPV